MSVQIELTESEFIIMSCLVRVGAGISFLCALYLSWTILRNPFYRKRIYHRIMFGCAVNTMVLNCNILWGPAAVPIGTPGFVGANGTKTTCSVQGFLYTMGFVVPNYYVALSLVCCFALRNQFQIQKYEWIEKYIHVGVHLFPFVTGFYILSIEGYNPSVLDCYFVSIPYGCGGNNVGGDNDDGFVECTRGPDNFVVLARWLIGFPLGMLLLFPTVVMIIVYMKIRRCRNNRSSISNNGTRNNNNNNNNNKDNRAFVASSVAKQAGIYLLALYWTYVFRFLYYLVTYKVGTYVYTLHVLSNLIEAMQGVWISMAYYYLPSSSSSSSNENTLSKMHSLRVSASLGAVSAASSSSSKGGNRSKHTAVSNASFCQGNKNNDNDNKDKEEDERNHSNAGRSSSGNCSSTSSFSIFDGSSIQNLDSPWAKYLLDEGEDEEYQEDCGEYDDNVYSIMGNHQ